MSYLPLLVAQCYGPGGPQDCEDFTYVGSLVEDVPWPLALEELELVQEELEKLSGTQRACEEPLEGWLRQVELYFQPLDACLELFEAIRICFQAMCGAKGLGTQVPFGAGRVHSERDHG